MRPRQECNRKIHHQCRTWWLFWWQRANAKRLCPVNLNSWNNQYMYISSWNIFVFLASPFKTNLALTWRQTDVITAQGALWPSSRSDVGSNEILTQVVCWTPWRRMIDMGVNSDVSQLVFGSQKHILKPTNSLKERCFGLRSLFPSKCIAKYNWI